MSQAVSCVPELNSDEPFVHPELDIHPVRSAMPEVIERHELAPAVPVSSPTERRRDRCPEDRQHGLEQPAAALRPEYKLAISLEAGEYGGSRL
jgi:hypothetical protein